MSAADEGAPRVDGIVETFDPMPRALDAQLYWQTDRYVVMRHLAMQIESELSAERAKRAELEENEREYERILGPKSYAELADEIAELRADLVTSEVMLRARVTELNAANKRISLYSARNNTVGIDQLNERAESAEARLKEAREDAERYRWLRDRHNGADDQWFIYGAHPENDGSYNLDAAIDAARAIAAQEAG